MPSAGFELEISAVEQLQTYAFDRTAAGNPCGNPCVIWITIGNWSTSYQTAPQGIIDCILLSYAVLPIHPPVSPVVSACAAAYWQNCCCCS